VKLSLELRPAQNSGFVVSPQACQNDSSDDETISQGDRVAKDFTEVAIFLRKRKRTRRQGRRVCHRIKPPPKQLTLLCKIGTAHLHCTRRNSVIECGVGGLAVDIYRQLNNSTTDKHGAYYPISKVFVKSIVNVMRFRKSK